MIRILQGNMLTCRLTQSAWADILLTLENWGWHPPHLRTSYLASNAIIDATDAGGMAEAGNRLMQALLADPLTCYVNLKVDMGKLAEIVALCEDGGFTVGNE